MESKLKLSPRHGLNPSLGLCFYCGEATSVALLGLRKGDVRAPRAAVYDYQPCPKCEGWMEEGVILISVDPGRTTDQRNPYRSGRWVVVKDRAIQKILDVDTAADVLKRRVAFVPDDVWAAMGIPDGDAHCSEEGSGS